MATAILIFCEMLHDRSYEYRMYNNLTNVYTLQPLSALLQLFFFENESLKVVRAQSWYTLLPRY